MPGRINRPTNSSESTSWASAARGFGRSPGSCWPAAPTVTGSDGKGLAGPRRPARARRRVHLGHDAEPSARRRHPGGVHRRPPGQPRIRGGAPGRACGSCPARPRWPRDGRDAGRRRRRHPRQDHDHLAVDRRPPGGGPGSDVRHRRRARGHRNANADEGSGDLFVAEADESDGAFLVYSPSTPRSSRTSTPAASTSGGPEEAYRRGLRRVRRHASTRTASWSAASTTPAPRRLARRPGSAARVGTAASRDADLRARPGVDGVARRQVARGRASAGVTLLVARATTTSLDALAALADRGASSASPRTTWSAGSRRYTTANANEGARARVRSPASASTTAMPTTRPRSPATSRPLARSAGKAGWSWPSNPTWSRAPASSARRWGSPSARPTRSSSSTSTSPAGGRRPRP